MCLTLESHGLCCVEGSVKELGKLGMINESKAEEFRGPKETKCKSEETHFFVFNQNDKDHKLLNTLCRFFLFLCLPFTPCWLMSLWLSKFFGQFYSFDLD